MFPWTQPATRVPTFTWSRAPDAADATTVPLKSQPRIEPSFVRVYTCFQSVGFCHAK